jgi:hypothetical protein
MFIRHSLVPWVLASVAGFIAASICHTHSVLYRLTALGVDIPPQVRARATLDDLLGLAPTYLPIIAIGMAIAFFVASALVRRLPIYRTALFALAGFCAMATILLAMFPIMEITLVAGARGWQGLLAQGLAGALSGAVFATTRPPKSSG